MKTVERQVEGARGVGERPAVVARRGRHESRRIRRAGPLANAQRGVERAANLVRAGGLDGFELEVTRRRRTPPTASPSGAAASAARERRDPFAAASRMSESRSPRRRRLSGARLGECRPAVPANCDRGSTLSAPAVLRGGDQVGVDVRRERDRRGCPRAPRPPSSAAIVAIASIFWLFRSKITSVGCSAFACATISSLRRPRT